LEASLPPAAICGTAAFASASRADFKLAPRYFSSHLESPDVESARSSFSKSAIDDGALIEEVKMNTRAMAIIAASVLAACSSQKSTQTLTLTVDKQAMKAFVNKSNAAKLATQLEKIHYPATVTIEGETVSIRVNQAPIRNVRRAVCRRIGWPLSEFKTEETTDDTLKYLWRWGARKIKIIGDAETMDVELGRDGRCQEDSR
jgi:hypothetical protein